MPFERLSELPQLEWCRIDPLGPGLHEPKRPGDVGWDLEAADFRSLRPGESYDVPVNVRVRLPDDAWGEIRARSSIARKHLQVDAGVIDTGYTGPLFVLLRNVGQTVTSIHKGDRIGQLVLHYAYRAVGREVSFIAPDSRRGDLAFGSTGR